MCTCPRETPYAFLPIVSHYSIDLEVAVMCDKMQQCANKGTEEENCFVVTLNIKNIAYKL